MEQTALRPKPMPGRETGADRPSGTARRPHAAPRRARQRLITLLFALVTCAALVLSGVGLGTMGATVIGMSRLAELRERGSAPDAPGASARPDGVPKSTSGKGSSVPAPTGAAAGAPTRPTLGVEVVDAPGGARGTGDSRGAAGAGARVVGVHVPGPGYSAGLVRGTPSSPWTAPGPDRRPSSRGPSPPSAPARR